MSGVRDADVTMCACVCCGAGGRGGLLHAVESAAAPGGVFGYPGMTWRGLDWCGGVRFLLLVLFYDLL